MITRVLEDIYVYIDKVQEITDTLSGASNFSLTNDSIGGIVDYGVIEIIVNSGIYDGLTISSNFNTMEISKPLAEGDSLLLDLREEFYTLNGSVFFIDDRLVLEDDVNNTISLAFSGTGDLQVNYTRRQIITNNDDLYFCTGFDMTDNSEIIKSVNIKAQTKIRKTAKKDYQWSINGLCNDQELQKFQSDSGLFRLRLIDEEGVEMQKLANCSIASFQQGASDGGDYTYSLNGSFEKIFN
ncbi:hypothetical protein [Priestia megaterium]|uniref:hypothetical protein n=1 Tax=Priestia megaterium TaxID=1404 RepID=UPI00211BDC4C|nr:hypothetical protein [Priestia megaterium]